MARPVSNKITVSRVIRTSKYGTRYVYERHLQYMPELKQTRVIQNELVGIMKPDSNDMYDLLPTRPKGSPQTDKQQAGANSSVSAEREHTGLIDIVKRVEELTIIEDAVNNALTPNEGLAQKARTMAWFSFATDGDTWPKIKAWSLRYAGLLPYTFTCMSTDIVHDVLKELGKNESAKQSIFAKCCEDIDEDSLLAMDSTTIKVYSERTGKTRKTVHKDRTINKVVKIQFFYDILRRMPVAFTILPSDIPDCTTVANGIKQIKAMKASKAELVHDNGYCTDGTLCTMLMEGQHFVTRIEPSVKWVATLIEKHRNELEHGGEIIECDHKFSGIKETITRVFTRRKRKGDPESGCKKEAKINVFIYFSSWNKAKDDAEFRKTFSSYAADLKEEKALCDEKKTIENFAAKYMIIERDNAGKIITIKANQEAYEEKMRYNGYLVILADKEDDINRALEKFRKREYIEEDIKNYKSHLGGNVERVWYDDTLEGQVLIQFLGLCMHEAFENRVRYMKKTLALITGDQHHDTDTNLKLERKLKHWIEKNSLHDILDWFDAVEKITVENNEIGISWTTEMSERDALFLELMGITQ